MGTGYYRPTSTNPNWTESWQDQFDDGIPSEEILDTLARLSCGIEAGASDKCQRYAKHVHSHLIAAFELGRHVGKEQDALDRYKWYLHPESDVHGKGKTWIKYAQEEFARAESLQKRADDLAAILDTYCTNTQTRRRRETKSNKH